MESGWLGNTGLKVSRLALGCMSYGDPTTPGAHEWSLDDNAAQPNFEQADEPVVSAVEQVAEARGVTMAQVALAWVLQNPAVSASIVGATKPHHLPEAVAALDLDLADDEVRALEEHYTRHGPSWF